MEGTLVGIPFFALALVCLVLAVVWFYFWPKDRTPEPLKQLPEYTPRPFWMKSVLRWFHSLAWLMLAATCFFLDAGQAPLASLSAFLAGFMYIVFIVALLKDGQRRKAFEHEGSPPAPPRQPDR